MRVAAFLMATVVLIVAACDTDDDPNLLRKADGSPTGDGDKCSLSGVDYFGSGVVVNDSREFSVGQSFKAPDACNDCTCTDDGVSCTKEYGSFRQCTSPIKGTCKVFGVERQSGPDGFPCEDGCNTCWCLADGNLERTTMSCTK